MWFLRSGTPRPVTVWVVAGHIVVDRQHSLNQGGALLHFPQHGVFNIKVVEEEGRPAWVQGVSHQTSSRVLSLEFSVKPGLVMLNPDHEVVLSLRHFYHGMDPWLREGDSFEGPNGSEVTKARWLRGETREVFTGLHTLEPDAVGGLYGLVTKDGRRFFNPAREPERRPELTWEAHAGGPETMRGPNPLVVLRSSWP